MLTPGFTARPTLTRLRIWIPCLVLAGLSSCTQPQVGSFFEEHPAPPEPAPPRWRSPPLVDVPPVEEPPSLPSCPGLRAGGGWCWENPLPQGTPLFGAWSGGPDDLWMVGGGGTLLHWDGKKLAYVPSVATEADDLMGVWGTAPNDIWVVGGGQAYEHNLAQHWDGVRWQAFPTGASSNLLGVWGSSPNDYWAIGQHSRSSQGELFHWDGKSWSKQSYRGLPLRAIWGRRSDDVWITAIGGQNLHWDGVRWQSTKAAPNSLLHIWGSGPNDIWAGHTELVHFDGTNWNQFLGTNRDVQALGGFRSDDVWLADGIRLVRGVPGAWTDVVMGDAAERISTLTRVGSDEMWGTGYGGKMLRWRPAGADVLSSGSLRHLYALWGASPTDIWAAGFGTLMHGDGRTWTPVDIGTNKQIFAIGGSSSKDIWTAACGVGVAHYDGSTWSFLPGPAPSCWEGVWAFAPNDAWAVGYGIHHWDGTSWKTVEPPGGTDYHAVWGSGPNDVWFAGGPGIVKHWDGTSIELAWAISGGSFRSVFGTSAKDVWVAGYMLGHFDGSSWQTVPGLDLGSTINDLWGSAPDDMWAVGLGGELRHWDGMRWSPVRGATRGSLFSIFGFGRGDVRIAGIDGTVLRLP